MGHHRRIERPKQPRLRIDMDEINRIDIARQKGVKGVRMCAKKRSYTSLAAAERKIDRIHKDPLRKDVYLRAYECPFGRAEGARRHWHITHMHVEDLPEVPRIVTPRIDEIETYKDLCDYVEAQSQTRLACQGDVGFILRLGRRIISSQEPQSETKACVERLRRYRMTNSPLDDDTMTQICRHLVAIENERLRYDRLGRPRIQTTKRKMGP